MLRLNFVFVLINFILSGCLVIPFLPHRGWCHNA
jgi:hypothetical protein